MNRILVVDDEQPVVDHIVRIIERDLSGEFSLAGTASSGREALEQVPALRPDIVLMDVRMPGLSGLDTIRELQRRGSGAAFVLSTAYERFDIAREALELGITGYILKPVSRDVLAQSLRNAALQLARRSAVESKEFALQERDRKVQGFVTDAFLNGLMLGHSGSERAHDLQQWLGIGKPYGMVVAASFAVSTPLVRDRLEAVLQYKTAALCGPLVAGRCLIFLPLASLEEAERAQRELLEVLRASHEPDLQEGTLRLGISDARPLEELAQGWPEALGRLSRQGVTPRESTRFVSGGTFDDEQEFLTAVAVGDPERLRRCFEHLIEPLEALERVPSPDRYRVISLLGSALGRLVGLGQLDEPAAHLWMDFDDLGSARDGREFCLLARSRLPAITSAAARSHRWSAWISAAMEHIAQNYREPLTLDRVAEHAGVSPKRLSRLFIEELGQGFSDYLIDFRIEKAKISLALPGASIKQVSSECGYPDPNYFARLFKKVTGQTPSEFSAGR